MEMTYRTKSLLKGLACGLASKSFPLEMSGKTKPAYAPYLTFKSEKEFTLEYHLNHLTFLLEYSTDNETWKQLIGNTPVNSKNGVLYLRGYGNKAISPPYTNGIRFVGEEIQCIGNIETLLDYRLVMQGDHPPIEKRAFANLFNGASNLISAPDCPIVDITERCFNNTFSGTGIKKAPDLPAEILKPYCYRGMFANCIDLEEPAKDNAITLAPWCYAYMYQGCNLKSIPKLHSLSLPDYCYYNMFSEYTSEPPTGGITLYNQPSADHPFPYRIPNSGIGQAGAFSNLNMFSIGGDVQTPKLNKTYYVSVKPI